MIAVDWGTTNFRAFRLDENGAILARRGSAQGILAVPQGEFAAFLRQEVGVWLEDGENRILLSGMVGSRSGWVEAPYVPCPVTIEDLVLSAVKVPFPGVEVRLVPGVLGADANGVPEVMRGEEAEAMGLLEAQNEAGLMCFPGTHSKWIHLQAGKIVSFSTCMTGDVYGALRRCTILESTMHSNDIIDAEVFGRGVMRSADPGGLLHHLFGVRTLALTSQLEEGQTSSYLSGLLIGHEVRSTMPPSAKVHLVGAAKLCSLYSDAIKICGGSVTVEDGDAAVRGLAAIGRRIQWS